MRIKVNNRIIKEFEKFNIYSELTGLKPRYKVEEDLNIPIFQPGQKKMGYVEKFCGFLTGNNMWQMGAFSYSWSTLPTSATVGRYCSIANNLQLLPRQHPLDRISTSSFTYDANAPFFKFPNKYYNNGEFEIEPYPFVYKTVNIEHDVWIGADVVLKGGITIGTGAVIAAHALVTKDVPPYAIVGGIPAKLIRYRFDENTRARLLQTKWWKYNFSDFKGIDLKLDVNEYLDIIEDRILNNKITEFNPKRLYFDELTKLAQENIGTPLQLLPTISKQVAPIAKQESITTNTLLKNDKFAKKLTANITIQKYSLYEKIKNIIFQPLIKKNAFTHITLGNLGHAEAIAQNIIANNPYMAWAYYILGKVQWQRGEHDLAFTNLDRAISLEPNTKYFQTFKNSCLKQQKK